MAAVHELANEDGSALGNMDCLISDRDMRNTKKSMSVRMSESVVTSLLASKANPGEIQVEANSQSQVTLNDSASAGKDRAAAVHPDVAKLTSSSSLCKREEVADDLMSLEALHKAPMNEDLKGEDLKGSVYKETTQNIQINYSRISTRFSQQVPTNPLTSSLSQLETRNSFSVPLY